MDTLESQLGHQKAKRQPGSLREERIARLEERYRHTAAKADLYLAVLLIIAVIFALVGGLIIHSVNLQMALIEKLAGG